MQLKPLRTFRDSPLLREALRFAPVKPNYTGGLRAAIATTAPLLLLGVTGYQALSWTSLAGFNSVLVDKGGAYRTRALTIFAHALSGSLAVFAATLAAGHVGLSIPLVAVTVFACGLVRLYGAEATSIGVCTSVALVIGLSRPAGDVWTALSSAGFFAAGCAWAALLSLVLWPIRPYRPASRAIAAVLRQLATIAASFIGASDDADAQVARRALLAHAREGIEAARSAIGASRRGKPGPSRRGEQLVALLEAADLLFAALVALEDGLSLDAPDTLPALPHWIDASAKHIAAELTRVANALVDEHAPAPRPAARPSFAQIATALEPHLQAASEYVPRVLSRAIERLDYVVELAGRIGETSSPVPTGKLVRSEPADLSTRASKLSLLRDNLTLDSAMFRHALRMAIATSFAVAVAHAIELERGYWASLTCLVIMQPHGSATWAKALQRVGGTVLGAALAVVVASHVPVHWTVPFVFAFVGIGIALLPLNYGAFAVFLTPAFVLLAETQAGNSGLAKVRVINTLLGALVALLGARLLFPLTERDAFRPLMAEAFAALEGLLQVVASDSVSDVQLGAARRRLGLALLNAEASYQRLLTQTDITPSESEAVLTLLLYTHRLASGLNVLALVEGTPVHARLQQRARALTRQIEELRASTLARRAPALPAHIDAVEPDEGERVEVLFEQLAVLAGAARRWSERVEKRRGLLRR